MDIQNAGVDILNFILICIFKKVLTFVLTLINNQKDLFHHFGFF